MRKQDFTGNLQAYYTEHSGLTRPIITLDQLIDTGWESEIYIYTLTYGPDSARTSVKRALRLLTGADFSDAKDEFTIISLLHQAGYPVPQVFELGKPGEVFRHPFIIMQCIQGDRFAHRFPKSLGDDQGPLKAFITLFRRLHTLEWRPFVENPGIIDPPNQPFFLFDRQLERFSNYLSRVDIKDLNPAIEWLIGQRQKATCKKGSVIHYDFHPDNILEDTNGKLYVVDWTSAEISDYRFDLAWTLTLALAYGGEVRWEMILKEYERQLGEPVPELDLFEAAAIVRRFAVVMASLKAGAEKLGMRPEAVQAMRKEVEPLTRLYERLQSITGLLLPEIKRFLNTL